jgi:hypothetical protein
MINTRNRPATERDEFPALRGAIAEEDVGAADAAEVVVGLVAISHFIRQEGEDGEYREKACCRSNGLSTAALSRSPDTLRPDGLRTAAPRVAQGEAWWARQG